MPPRKAKPAIKRGTEGASQPKVGKSKGNAGKGRRKGSVNKTTAALKDAILNAFNEVGGVDYLVTLAKTDPRTFAALLGRVLPLTVAGDSDSPLTVKIIRFSDA